MWTRKFLQEREAEPLWLFGSLVDMSLSVFCNMIAKMMWRVMMTVELVGVNLDQIVPRYPAKLK